MKYTLVTKDDQEAEILMAARENYNMLLELRMNFHRRFEKIEGSADFQKGMYKVLDELQKEIEDFKE